MAIPPAGYGDKLIISAGDERIISGDGIRELLVFWNENMHWNLSPAQIDEYTSSMENGVLKKYRKDPDNPHTLYIQDSRQFYRETGLTLGFTEEESEDFIRALDEYRFELYKASVHYDYRKPIPQSTIAINFTVQPRPTFTLSSATVTSRAGPGFKSRGIPDDKYVFFEHIINETGVTHSGNCGPGLNIDFPTYSFDREKGTLDIYMARVKTMDDSLVLIYGRGTYLSGTAGSGGGTLTSWVCAFPYSDSHAGNVTINSLEADGTVFFTYNNTRFSLGPDESRETTTRIPIRHGPPEYSVNCTGEITITDRFYNAGILDKKNIVIH